MLEKYLLNLDSISEGNFSIIKNLGLIRSEYYSLYMNEDISKISKKYKINKLTLIEKYCPEYKLFNIKIK